MGKRTLYHPVGLHVIRGGAENGGYLLGRLKQVYWNAVTREATYQTQLIGTADGLQGASLEQYRVDLDSCYALDVHVDKIWLTRSGKIMVSIHTQGERQLPLPAPSDPTSPDDLPF